MRCNVDNKRYASPIFVSLSYRRIRENAYIQSHTIPIVSNVELLNDRSNGDQFSTDKSNKRIQTIMQNVYF
jgi:hypothetical protein